MTNHREADRDEYALAELAAALVAGEERALAPELVARLQAVGEANVAATTTGVIPLASRRPVPTSLAWGGWAVAAAVALWAIAGRAPDPDTAQPLAAEALRTALVASHAPATWDRGGDPTARSAEGDVVWSDSAQAGVMRFRGLAVNDPTREQYQLWVFDASRDERYPVDGGVFDVPADGGEVLVPISPAIPVSRATLFVVTVERPGGVVVSDRSRIALLAKRAEST